MQRTLLLKHSTHLLYIHYWAWPLLAKPVSWGKCLCRNCSEAVKGVKVVPSALVLQQHEGLSFCRKSCSACKKATIHVIIIIHHHRSKGTFLLDHEWHIDLQDCIPLFTIRIASKNWNLPQFWKYEISIWLPYIIDGVVFFVQKESNTAGGYKLRLSKHSKLQLDENCAQTRHRLSRILPCRAVPRGKKHSCLFWGGQWWAPWIAEKLVGQIGCAFETSCMINVFCHKLVMEMSGLFVTCWSNFTASEFIASSSLRQLGCFGPTVIA